MIWFDRSESLQLSPGATLTLFRTTGEKAGAARAPLGDALDCPRPSWSLDASKGGLVGAGLVALARWLSKEA